MSIYYDSSRALASSTLISYYSGIAKQFLSRTLACYQSELQFQEEESHVLKLMLSTKGNIVLPLTEKRRATMTPTNPQTCEHTTLIFDPSYHATVIGYERPTAQQRAAATTRSGHVKVHENIEVPDPGTYPAPLVLPDDDLAIDPTYPPQTLRAWLREKDRNPVTLERKTIYVVRPPDVDFEVEFVKKWCTPKTTPGLDGGSEYSPPDVMDVVRYLQAFYHGMYVKLLPPSSAFKFAAWDDESDVEPLAVSPEALPKRSTKKEGKVVAKSKPKSKPKPRPAAAPAFIALQTSTEATRIRTRHSHGTSSSSLYPSQINLSDLLDATIALPPPEDAYALLLLVNQDLYEDDDDDFVCGRAYGGSRVAVVSTARYDPRLDALQSVYPGGEQHAWPGSCCAAFVEDMCRRAGTVKSAKGVSKESSRDVRLHASPQPVCPIARAITAASSAGAGAQPQPPPQPHHRSLSRAKKPLHDREEAPNPPLWLSRVCKTASHELGHCFGIDHCTYYACIMQGTATLSEDARQPPYLCPVDEMKLGVAVAAVVAAAASASTATATLSSTSYPKATTRSSTSYPKATTSSSKSIKSPNAIAFSGSITNPVVIDDDDVDEAEAETGGTQTRVRGRGIVIRAGGGKREREVGGLEMTEGGGEKKMKVKTSAKAKGRAVDDAAGGKGGETETERLEIWKCERRGHLRAFCQEIICAWGGEAAGPFWRAFDAWLEGGEEVERNRGKGE